MKAVIQRVKWAKVTVDGNVVGEIRRGILALVGISVRDTGDDIDFMSEQLLNAPIFDGPEKKASVLEMDLGILCVSQFTLLGKTAKGNKPDFHDAMKGSQSRPMFDHLVSQLRASLGEKSVQTGEFGAMMEVSLENDGPMMFQIDSDN
ncbi:D-tyrosyl-tRNA(Tyr) deacylase [Smittium culicis]|uniref:D-aminoacyl-tRNA deacylase n=1 Tax=Smittium culicis TaxID=133412 RepID=A0A1R1YFT9_9FUNG|nr:D-tyrosyl-tRNA(Tyr) deacylase [Smittium culicis]